MCQKPAQDQGKDGGRRTRSKKGTREGTISSFHKENPLLDWMEGKGANAGNKIEKSRAFFPIRGLQGAALHHRGREGKTREMPTSRQKRRSHRGVKRWGRKGYSSAAGSSKFARKEKGKSVKKFGLGTAFD